MPQSAGSPKRKSLSYARLCRSIDMELPRPCAIKHLSVGNLSVVILVGVLSVWLLGALAYGFVSDGPRPESDESNSRTLDSTAAGDGSTADLPTFPSAAPPAKSSGFTVDCDRARDIARQAQASFNCRVMSEGDFSEAVSLTCANLPKGLACETVPSTVTPPPGGSGNFKLSLYNLDTQPGRHNFNVIGTYGPANESFTVAFDSTGQGPAPRSSAPAPASVDIECQTGSTRLIPGQSISYKCSYSSELFYGTITTGCTGTPGVACEVTPKTLAPRDGQPAEATLTLSVAPEETSAGTNQVISIYGDSTDLARSSPRPVKKFTVDVPPPDYTLACATNALDVEPGAKAALTCRVASTTGYVGPLYVKVIRVDSGGPVATVSPRQVQVGPNKAVDSTASFVADSSGAPGAYRYLLGVFAGEQETFGPSFPDSPRQVTVTVTVPQPSGATPDAFTPQP